MGWVGGIFPWSGLVLKRAEGYDFEGWVCGPPGKGVKKLRNLSYKKTEVIYLIIKLSYNLQKLVIFFLDFDL